MITHAEIYAALHRGTAGDLAFYVAQCDGAKAVLELGCGFCRVLQALADRPRRLVGVDQDEALLQLARTRLADAGIGDRVELHRDDMRTVTLGETFDRVLMPHAGIYCLRTDADVMRCLANARAHLRPGGRLIFDAWAADAFAEDVAADDGGEHVSTLPPIDVAGATWTVHERSELDRAAQRIDVVYTLTAPDGTPHHNRVTHHYRTAAQLVAALEASKFRVRSVDGGFDGELYDDDAEAMVVVAIKTTD